MLEIKNTRREVKNAFGGLISRTDTAEERNEELGDMLTEASHTKMPRGKIEKTDQQVFGVSVLSR